MQRLLGYFQRQPAYLLAFYLLFISQLLLFLFISFRPYSLTPPGHNYAIIDKNFFYPNLIFQGRDGEWKILDTHTTRFSPRIYAYTFFIILGKFSALSGIQPVWLYWFARLGMGVLMFITTLWFIKKIVPQPHRLASVIFVLLIESGPLLINLPELKPLFEGRMLLVRHFGLPHHVFAHATGMIFVGLLFLLIKQRTTKKLITFTVIGLLSTISMPAYTFTFALTSFPIIFLWSILAKKISTVLPLLILATIIIVAPNIIFAIEFTKGPPWTNSTPNEKTWFTTEYVRMEYLSTFLLYVPGIILFLVLLPLIWKKANSITRVVILSFISWVLSPALLVALAKTNWFPMPNHRLTDGYSFLPAGILTGLAITTLISAVNLKIWKVITILLAVILFILPSLYLTVTYTSQLLKTQEIIDIHVYPTTSIWKGLHFIDSLPKNSGILSREYFGELIPGFANVRVFVGGIHNFPDWLERQWLANRFFSGVLSTQEAKDFMQSNNINYVFFSPDEKAVNTTGTLYPSLLKEIYTSQDLTIFEFKP